MESHEGFVDLATYDERIAVDLTRSVVENTSPHFLKVRRGIAERLVAATHALTAGLRLYVKEGYRPLALQREYFASHLAQLRATLNPLPSDDALVELASRYIAPPEVAAHPTGAAVDISLILGRHPERIARHLRSRRGKHARRSIAMTVFPT